MSTGPYLLSSDSITTGAVDDTAYSLRQCTAVDPDDRGRWTEIFGGVPGYHAALCARSYV